MFISGKSSIKEKKNRINSICGIKITRYKNASHISNFIYQRINIFVYLSKNGLRSIYEPNEQKKKTSVKLINNRYYVVASSISTVQSNYHNN